MTRHPHTKKMNPVILFPSQKNNSKRNTDFNVKHNTIKLLEHNTGENLDYLGYVNAFVDTISKA